MPSMSAPSETRKRQRSCTCGSQAALPIVVSPGASAAAMTMFSVAITLASSRKTSRAAHARRCASRSASPTSTSAPSSVNAWMCGSSRRRPMTSPPGGATLARPQRASSGPASRNDARIRSSRARRSSSSCEMLGGVDADLVRPGPLDVGAEVVRAARASCRRRGSAARCAARPARLVSRHAARIGSTPFLLPAARHAAVQGLAAFDHERLVSCVWRRPFRSWATGLWYPAP